MDEDHLEKVDLVVTTADVGKLYLQVKSSRAGVMKFSERRKRKDIAVVIIKAGEDAVSIRRRVIRMLAKKREEYLRGRRV